MNRIQVSVIIPAYNATQTIERCLESLKGQANQECFEVIVVDSSDDDTPILVNHLFPHVQLYHFETRLFPGNARNYGVTQSQGTILAFLDADCWVEPTWINQIIAAHKQTEHPVVGGAIANGNPESYVGWGYYFSGLSQWMPQTSLGERIDIPTGCLSCKRWAFEQYGPFLEGSLCEDTLFNWKLADAGYKAWFVPTIQVFHTNITDLDELIKRKIKHGKAFAQLRVVEKQFSLWKQTIYAMGSVLLPFIIARQRISHVLRAKTYWRQFILTLPITLIGILCWSLGEFLGYAQYFRTVQST